MPNRNSTLSTEACGAWGAALERHWAGARVVRLEVAEDAIWPGQLCGHIALSGPESDLVRHGLVSQRTLDSLPPCGAAWRGGLQIRRRKRITHVRCALFDGGHTGVDRDRLEAAFTIAMGRQVWTPPTARAR